MSDANINNWIAAIPFNWLGSSTALYDYGKLKLSPIVRQNAIVTQSISKFWYGSCLSLDGVDDSAQFDITNVKSQFNLQGQSITYECWFYEISSASGGQLFCHRYGGGTAGWALTSSALRAKINGVWSDTQITFTRPSYGVWHHIALVMNGGTTITIYIDGVSVGTKTGITSVDDIGGGDSIEIAANDSNTERDFYGYIQDFRVSSFARYTSSFTPPNSLLQIISGKIETEPINCKVAAFPRLSPYQVFKGQGNASTGRYDLIVPDAEMAVVVLSPDAANFNDITNRCNPSFY